MAKNSDREVRNHSSEREWLRSRGNGSVVAGARSIVEEAKNEQSNQKKSGR